MEYKNYTSLMEAIQDIYGTDRQVKTKRSISGGDINESYALTLDDGTVVFMKSNSADAFPNFVAEAKGLEAIRNTGTIGAAKVLGLGVDSGNISALPDTGRGSSNSFLLLEYIAGSHPIDHFWETFAVELASMHQAEPEENIGFGFSSDNWIGMREQLNTPHDSWIDFYRDCRLKPQFDSAKRFFSNDEKRKADSLLSHLDLYLIEPEKPSLVHGDLWAGNMITGSDGKGWLIDPAVYYGHPEVDIAMTELFGGFSYRFYEAYKEAGRMAPGYTDRRDLYNLYQLLNHLNMFGYSYLSSVLRIIDRFAQN